MHFDSKHASALALIGCMVAASGCSSETPVPSDTPQVETPATPGRGAGDVAPSGVPGVAGACTSMKGSFDASAWQGLVDSLPPNYVKSVVGFTVPSVLRAQVYENSSWVTIGGSVRVEVDSKDSIMTVGGTRYPADSSGHVTELADYQLTRRLFDLLVRANETKKTESTLAAGDVETVTRASANTKVECVTVRSGIGGVSPREDVLCKFHSLLAASNGTDCP